MARQDLDMSVEVEQERLQKLWDAYRAQEDELMAIQGDLDAATTSRDDFKTKFEIEKERLQKLWDAYRAQEDELKELKERIPLMEEKLVERERTIESLKQDVALLEPLTKKGQASMELQAENERLKADNEVLRSQANGDADKQLAKTQAELAKEQERLEKLFERYQDQEAEAEALRKTIKEWETWAKKVRPALEA